MVRMLCFFAARDWAAQLCLWTSTIFSADAGALVKECARRAWPSVWELIGTLTREQRTRPTFRKQISFAKTSARSGSETLNPMSSVHRAVRLCSERALLANRSQDRIAFDMTKTAGGRFVHAYKPEYLFVENVPELHAFDESNGPFSEFLEFLTDLKYWHAYKILVAYHYGVPQRRRRLILVASRLGPIDFPAPTHGPNSRNPSLPTVWEFISGLPPLEAGESHPTIPNHRAANLSELNLQRIASTPRGGGRRSWPKRLKLECHKGHSGHTDVYGRMA
jgi:hypothetical protein